MNKIFIKAESEIAETQYDLNLKYEDCVGVPKEAVEAAQWFRRAADQGLAMAQNRLGFMYANGQGVPQDYSEAVSWFRKAAEQGLADAQHNLGMMYEKGHGVPQDDIEAVKWYRKANDACHVKKNNGMWVTLIILFLFSIPVNFILFMPLIMSISAPGAEKLWTIRVFEKLLDPGWFIIPSFMLISIGAMFNQKEKLALYFAAATVVWPFFLFALRIGFIFVRY